MSLKSTPWNSSTVPMAHPLFGDSDVRPCFRCRLSVVRCPWSASVEWCRLGSKEGNSPRPLLAVFDNSFWQQATDNRQRTRPFRQKMLRREFQLPEGVTFGEKVVESVTYWSHDDGSVITIEGVLQQGGPPHGGPFFEKSRKFYEKSFQKESPVIPIDVRKVNNDNVLA